MSNLERIQQKMKDRRIDAVLLGGDGAGHFAVGHLRIGVHIAGSPIPTVVIPREGPPHVVTADPDGATELPADHVHGMMWNPLVLVDQLPQWLGARNELTVAVDALSPGGRELIGAALPGCRFVDANDLLAELLQAKQPDEIRVMGEVCRLATEAATAGRIDGRPAMYRVLAGAFPVTYPLVEAHRAWVSVRRSGLIGEARLGPGEASVGRAAVEQLVAGRTPQELGRSLPSGVEVVGLGRSYEPPLIRAGRGFPAASALAPGAVLAVHWDDCGVTIVVTEAGNEFLSLTPEEVSR